METTTERQIARLRQACEDALFNLSMINLPEYKRETRTSFLSRSSLESAKRHLQEALV